MFSTSFHRKQFIKDFSKTQINFTNKFLLSSILWRGLKFSSRSESDAFSLKTVVGYFLSMYLNAL